MLRRRILVAVFATLALGGCKASPGATPTPTASLGSSEQLGALALKVQASGSATSKATYQSIDQGQTASFTIERKQSKLLIRLEAKGTLTYISDGTMEYTCSAVTEKISCLVVHGNQLVGVLDTVTPTFALAAMQGPQAFVAATPGVSFSYSSKRFAGQQSTCLTIAYPVGDKEFCITDGGLLAYQKIATETTTELTSFTSVVPDSDFTLPGPIRQELAPLTSPT